jgi:hypothetical protein
MMSQLTPAERHFITKNASNYCGVGTTLVQWKFQADATCPRCGAVEDGIHVYRCRGSDADEVWNKNLQKLAEYMSKSETDPKLQDALLSGVSCWRHNTPINPSQFAPKVCSLIRQQHAIGWKNLIEGLPSRLWKQGQQQYYDEHRIRKSSRRWIQGVLARLARLGRGQWIHRNDEKHSKQKPRHKRALQLLRKATMWLYSKRTRDLLQGDHGHMNVNLCDLLSRSTAYQQAWYTDVVTARNRCLRIQYQDPELEDPPPHDQDIKAWISGRPL